MVLGGEEGLEGRWPGARALAPLLSIPSSLLSLKALLLRHPSAIEAHVHQELGHIHPLLPRELVPDGGARGVAVGPGAGVHQVDGAALQGELCWPCGCRGGFGPSSAAPEAVSPLHLDVCPVAADRNLGLGITRVWPKQGTALPPLSSCHTAGLCKWF